LLLLLLLLLLLQVDAFKAKSGKFAIKGYPHKLGFLLHGPPGKLFCSSDHQGLQQQEA
jgi:hypothetical protein